MQYRFQVSNSFLATCLVVIGFTVYLSSFGNSLFWDDDDFILHNTYIQDTQYLPKLFSENVIAGSGLVSDYWRPVLLMVFSAEWHLWGDWAPGWHAVNTLFHVADGVLLFWVLLSMSFRPTSRNPSSDNWIPGQARDDKTKWVAFFVALLFLVHPVQVEAVAYANSLGDSLSVFFMFVGVLCFQRSLEDGPLEGRPLVWLTASVAAYPLAIASKETAIIMPGLLALIVVLNRASKRIFDISKRLPKILWPFVVITITYIALRATTLNFKNSFNLYDQQNAFTSSLWVRLLTFCKIIVEYIKLIFWPQHLHMERSLDFATSLWDAQVIIGALIITGLLVLAWKSWRRIPLITFGVLWFFIALAPISNILIPVNGLLYEHWLYVPIVGVGIAVLLIPSLSFPTRAWSSEARPSRIRRRESMSAYQPTPWLFRGAKLWIPAFARMTDKTLIGTVAIMVIVFSALSTRTILRIRDWQDPVTFYQQTIKYAPNSYRINNNLGMVLANQGDLQESIPYYQKAIELDPSNAVAYHNLGNTYAGIGQFSLALRNYQKAISLDPNFLFTYGKLINLYAALGQYQSALNTLEQYEAQVGKTPELEAVKQELQAAQTK